MAVRSARLCVLSLESNFRLRSATTCCQTRVAETAPHPGPDKLNIPHGWNCTNLHTHGLHVSPEDLADNIFVEIPPGGFEHAYEYCIPKNHVAGTFWYHAHKHGSVAMQVTNGLAGALIVEGGLDELPEIRQARERIFVLQQLRFTPDPGNLVTPQPGDLYDRFGARAAGPGRADDMSQGKVTIPLVNGQLHPTISVQPGAVERWRFVHAGVDHLISVAVVKDDAHLLGPPDSVTHVPLHEIAVDGIPRGKCTPRNAYDMYPGYRWDALFKTPSEPGNYFLVSAPVAPERVLREEQATAVQPQEYLARIVVEGPPARWTFPQVRSCALRATPVRPRNRRRNHRQSHRKETGLRLRFTLQSCATILAQQSASRSARFWPMAANTISRASTASHGSALPKNGS